jgi:hypothetical protein
VAPSSPGLAELDDPAMDPFSPESRRASARLSAKRQFFAPTTSSGVGNAGPASGGALKVARRLQPSGNLRGKNTESIEIVAIAEWIDKRKRVENPTDKAPD